MQFNNFSKSHSKQFVGLWFVFIRKQQMSGKCITFLAMQTEIAAHANCSSSFFLSFFLSSFSKPSAVLSERITTKPAQLHVYISGVVHLLLR